MLRKRGASFSVEKVNLGKIFHVLDVLCVLVMEAVSIRKALGGEENLNSSSHGLCTLCTLICSPLMLFRRNL